MGITKTKDEAIHDIGRMVIRDEQYVDHEWSAISIVGRVRDTAVNITGYMYKPDDWEGATPDSLDFPPLLQELRSVMLEELGGDPWKTCLIQIKREDLSIDVQFDYEDENKWTKDLPTLHERLRPI